MFGIRSQQTKANLDPLQSRRTVMAWFGQLPPLDVMARAQLAIDALEAMHQAGVKIDRDRVSALGYLDAAVEGDLRRLVAWYLENHEASPGLAERFWQAAHDLNAAFVRAFAHAVDPACAAGADPRWKAVLPLLIAELIRCHGVDALLRLYRRQHWIPSKWTQLHALFRRATELGIERVAATPDSTHSQAPLRTVEQEYLYVLLIHLLDTGNLAPAELEWASQAILAWSGDLSLDAAAWSREGFFVDLNGSAGLTRRSGNDLGTMVGYLDTTRLAQRLDAALAEARETPADLGADAMAARERHIATLEKMQPAFSPKRAADYRRHSRLTVDAVVTVRIGLPRICQVIAESDGLADDIAEAARGTAAAPAPPFKPPSAFSALRYDDEATAEPTPNAGVALPTVEPNWRITDMSPVGFRITAPDFLAPSLALGALVVAQQADTIDWRLGVVRRLNDSRKGEIDAGVSLIAERVVVVTLYPQRPAQAGMSFVVDGVDTSTIGARCSGLYPLPPAGVDASGSMRTLVMPVAEYTEGRRLILVTSRSDYMVVTRRLIDRHAEWIWVTMQIVKRLSRGA